MPLLYCMKYIMFICIFSTIENKKYISIEGAEINKCEEEANKFAKYFFNW